MPGPTSTDQVLTNTLKTHRAAELRNDLGSKHPEGTRDVVLYPRDRRPVPAERRPVAFTFKLETMDGAPPIRRRSKLSLRSGGRATTIPLGGRALRVVGVRATDVDETPVLIVQDVSE